jgi:hydrogenase maturation factor
MSLTGRCKGVGTVVLNCGATDVAPRVEEDTPTLNTQMFLRANRNSVMSPCGAQHQERLYCRGPLGIHCPAVLCTAQSAHGVCVCVCVCVCERERERICVCECV